MNHVPFDRLLLVRSTEMTQERRCRALRSLDSWLARRPLMRLTMRRVKRRPRPKARPAAGLTMLSCTSCLLMTYIAMPQPFPSDGTCAVGADISTRCHSHVRRN